MAKKFMVLQKSRIFRGILIIILLLIILGLVWRRSHWGLNRFDRPLDYNFHPQGLKTMVTEKNQDVREEKVYSLPTDQESSFNNLYIFFSPDGSKMAYATSRGSAWAVVINGQAGEAYDSFGPVQFSPDSQHFAYTAKKDNKEMVVIDGQAGPAFDWTFEPKTFTPDSRFFVYKARKDNKDLIMVNNWSSQLYDQIFNFNFNSDKSQLIIFAKKDKDFWRLTIDLDKSKETK